MFSFTIRAICTLLTSRTCWASYSEPKRKDELSWKACPKHFLLLIYNPSVYVVHQIPKSKHWLHFYGEQMYCKFSNQWTILQLLLTVWIIIFDAFHIVTYMLCIQSLNRNDLSTFSAQQIVRLSPTQIPAVIICSHSQSDMFVC